MKNLSTIILIIIALITVSCASKKKSDDSVDKKASTNATRTTATKEPVKATDLTQTTAAPKATTIALPKDKGGAQLQAPDSLFASLERTSCYGKCPAYSITIYKSGYTIYYGKRFVPNEGRYTGITTQEEMDRIKTSAASADYFSLQDIYDSGVSDLPSTLTFLNYNGMAKGIKNRHNGPDALKQFEKAFDQIFEGKNWQPMN